MQERRIQITPVSPKVAYRHYSNPSSNGSLVRATAKWPKDYSYLKTRESLKSVYIDRVFREDSYRKFIAVLGGMGTEPGETPQQGGICQLVEEATEEQFLQAIGELFELPGPWSARCIFYYNLSSGYPCECLQAIYRVKPNITDSMRLLLRDMKWHKDPMHSRRGQSEHGGAAGTLRVAMREGWVCQTKEPIAIGDGLQTYYALTEDGANIAKQLGY